MNRSVETSCMMSSFAKILIKGSGDIGLRVFGSKGGGNGSGRSGRILYQ